MQLEFAADQHTATEMKDGALELLLSDNTIYRHKRKSRFYQ